MYSLIPISTIFSSTSIKGFFDGVGFGFGLLELRREILISSGAAGFLFLLSILLYLKNNYRKIKNWYFKQK